MALYGYIALYFLIPILGVMISGRKLSLKGWLFMLTLWPIAWLITGPEELP